MYGLVRGFVFGFVLILVGMCIGGDGHAAAAIISGLFGWIFRYPVFATVLIIGAGLGIYIGHERAIDRMGERDKAIYRARIKSGG